MQKEQTSIKISIETRNLMARYKYLFRLRDYDALIKALLSLIEPKELRKNIDKK